MSQFCKTFWNVRKLAKISDAWKQVYKTYAACLGLLVLITVIRSIIDFIVACLIVITIFMILLALSVISRHMTLHHTLWKGYGQ